MRARNIKPSFFRNELLAEVTPDVRLLFIGLWCMADREGRVENRPTRIKLEIAPLDSINVASAIKELEEKGFIKTYVADEKSVIQIINFLKHQNPHSTERDSLLPDESGSYVVNKRNNNKSITGEYELKNSPLTVKRQLINSSDEVKQLSHNALNPESLILNDESKDIGSSDDKPVRFSAKQFLIDRGVDPKLTDEYLSVRKAKKATNTETAFVAIEKEVEKAGITFQQAITRCVIKSWSGFKASWPYDEDGSGANAAPVNEHILRMRRDGLLPQEAA